MNVSKTKIPFSCVHVAVAKLIDEINQNLQQMNGIESGSIHTRLVDFVVYFKELYQTHIKLQ